MPLASLEDRLDTLAEVATICGSSHDLDDILGPILRVLSERSHVLRPTLTLFDRQTGTLRMEAAHGLTPTEIRRIQFEPGEGITGHVLQGGEVAVVRRVSQDARFADKSGVIREGDRSVVCVPILYESEVIGTLSGYRTISTERELEPDVALLSATAGMLVPAVRAKIAERFRVDAGDAPRFQPANIIGRSKAMWEVYAQISQVADSHTTVLLRGESGTGKELVATAIHTHSPRARAPFVKVNCAALPAALIESELFGHERGAFTGAIQAREGRFGLAEGGTLFLDEIGDLSPQTQIKLLRVLQEREYERVGGTRTVKADVRVIAATSRDLEHMIEEGGFRADLYYRLNVFPIRLPPLRERKADVLLLADHFVERMSKAHGKQVRRIATSAIDMLMAYHWPGNVRELENCIERAVLLAREDVILGHHLPPTLQTGRIHGRSGGLKGQLEGVERELILDALKNARGNMARAARELDITERVMGLRIRHYGIDARKFKVRPTR